jgi:hypothetical protein
MENNSKIKEQGVALFVVQEDLKDNLYFEEYLPTRIKRNMKLSSGVLSLRNILIIMAIVEVVASIWGFSYYFIRRVYTNLTSLVFNICFCKCISFPSINSRHLRVNSPSGNMLNDICFSMYTLKYSSSLHFLARFLYIKYLSCSQ